MKEIPIDKGKQREVPEREVPVLEDRGTDAVKQAAYEARREFATRTKPLFRDTQKLTPNGNDVLPQQQPNEDSFRSAIRVVLHALGTNERIPTKIVLKEDRDYQKLRRVRVHTRASELQTHGAETLKKYLKPAETSVDTSRQSLSQFGKLSKMAKKILPSTGSDEPFKAEYVTEGVAKDGSNLQLLKALDKGPVIYGIRDSRTYSPIRHIAVLDYKDQTITYADNGKLYRVPGSTFFDKNHHQYGDEVLVETKQEFPTWKNYQEKLHASLHDSQQDDRGEGPSGSR